MNFAVGFNSDAIHREQSPFPVINLSAVSPQDKSDFNELILCLLTGLG